MSSKVSNPTTAANTATGGGRRTPLSLGTTTTTTASSKTNQKSESTNPADSTTIDLKNRKLSIDERPSKNNKLDSPAKNVSAKDSAVVDLTTPENKKEKTSKKDSTNAQQETNGHSDEKIVGSQKSDTKKLSREGLRHKEVLKNDTTRESNKEIPENVKEKDNKQQRSTPVKIDQSQTNVEEILPQKSTRSSRAAAAKNLTGGSLALQSDFAGFEADNDVEMESLLLDVDVSESATTIPTAAKTSKDGGRSSIPISKRSARKDHPAPTPPAPAPVTPIITKLPAIDVPVTSTPEGKPFYTKPPSSLRQISGRRSLRPLKEYTFQYNNSNYRESYRQINSDLDYTNNTSMNVTIGSEAPSSMSFLTSFFSFGRGKKRALTPPPIREQPQSTADDIQDDAVNTNTASPKRPRLDLSGLIGIVSSPVNMIKNRFIRTRIDAASTPNNKTEDVNDLDVVDNDEDGTESVSEIVAENKKQNKEQQAAEENKLDETNDNIETENTTDNEAEVAATKNDEIAREKNVQHLNENELVAGSDEALSDDLKSNRRERCNLM